jgi:4-amino-4-deoxy-L-arabinose transferase-like glycosyltransferase
MNRKDYLLLFFLTIISFVSRISLIEKVQSHWDGPQYSIAIVRYSFEQFTPAPPGYPLYIAMGKFFYFFFKDPHFAILLVSVFATVIGSIVFYLIGKSLYNRYVGLSSSIIFLSGSTFYYFGLTPYAYITTPITTSLLAYVVYQIYIKNKQFGIWLGLTFGICFGIRPQETILTFPLLVLGFIYLSNKEKIKSLITFLLITILWLIPVLNTIGIFNYFAQSYDFLKDALVRNTLNQRIELIIKGFLLSFGISGIFLLYFVHKLYDNYPKIIWKNSKVVIFYAIWIIPGLFYNLFLRTEHAGYQMSYLAACFLLI